MLFFIFSFTISLAIYLAISGVIYGVLTGGIYLAISGGIYLAIKGGISGSIFAAIFFTKYIFFTRREINFTIKLKHLNTQYEKTVNIGFSWTTFFFGFWVPLLRGDLIRALIFFLIGQIIVSPFYYGIYGDNISILVIGFILIIIYSTIIGFIYNNIYLNFLKEKGYVEIDKKQEVQTGLNNNTDKKNNYEEIETLYTLKEKGIITEEEFEIKKKKLLGL